MNTTGYANRQSGHGPIRPSMADRCPGRGDFVGSTPTSVTDAIPWSSGKDAWMTPRRTVVRFYPGSLIRRSVGVVAAHRCGKAEDRVQVPNGPLERGLLVQRQDTWLASRRSGFKSSAVHSKTRAHGPRGRLQFGRLAIRVRFPVGPLTYIRKVAGYGSPGRFAKPCDLRVMWVQIPCLPLTARW